MYRSSPALATAALTLVSLVIPVHAAAVEWKPISPSELALKAPHVDPEANAEALLWEVRVADEIGTIVDEFRTVFHHYVRIKIFTSRGRESYATVDIPYTSGTQVFDVAARTVRADGSFVELRPSEVYRRTIYRAGDLKLQAVSFAVPAIEVGAIVEYQWREVQRDSLATYLRLPFSREIPTHLVRYHIRPLQLFADEFTMRAIPFNGEFAPPERQKDGFSTISLSNVPADADETYAPPPFEERPWLFIYYQQRSAPANDWVRFSKDLHDEYMRRSKPNDEIRTLAKAAAGTTAEDRIAALIGVAREKVKRVDVDTADAADLSKARDNKNAADVLKRGLGTGDDLMTLVLALANAAGFDARVAAVPNRADLFHKPTHDNPYFVRGRLIAVRSGDGWLLFDPANEHSTKGALPWRYERQEALIADPKQITSARTKLAGPEVSVKRRTGTFKLAEDGTLEGECRIVYSGHWAQVLREQEDQDAPSEREKTLRELITKRLPNAEISEVRIENVGNPAEPYVNAYRIRIPAYAQRAGDRLFLQPAIFQRGIERFFATDQRKSDIYFPFPWSERDEITIQVPSGFRVETPATVAPLDVGAGRYELKITADGDSSVRLARDLAFGRNDSIHFKRALYPQIKKFFDEASVGDETAVVLRRSAPQQ